MRRRYIQIDGILYEKGTEPRSEGVMIFGDIQPYQSMIDGSIITSRSQHREHLKAHGCIEIGNEPIKPRPLPDVSPQKRKELIAAQVNEMTYSEFKKALKRDADFVKWNSRKD